MNKNSIAIVAGLLMAGSLNSLAFGNNNIKCQPLLSLLYYRFSAMFPWRLILIGSMPIPLPMPVDWLERRFEICRKYLRWIIILLSRNVYCIENKSVKCERKNLIILRW